LIPLVVMAISFSPVSATTKTEKFVSSIENDLLRAVALLEDVSIVPQRLSVKVKTSKRYTPSMISDINSTLDVKDLVGLDLKQFLDDSKASQKMVRNRRPIRMASSKEKGIRASTYQNVMKLSTRRTKRSSNSRYRGCYASTYQELQDKSRRYQRSITAASRKHGVSENFIKSVITAESCFKIKARSHKGARGLMQLMPATAKRFGVRNSYDSHQNIGAGTKYLRWLLDRFKGNVQLALAGYNAGEGRVDQYGGVPPFRETRKYIKRVLFAYETLDGKKPQSAYLDDRSGVN